MLDLATAMILEICGGEASNIIIGGRLDDQKTIIYPLELTKKLLGI